MISGPTVRSAIENAVNSPSLRALQGRSNLAALALARHQIASGPPGPRNDGSVGAPPRTEPVGVPWRIVGMTLTRVARSCLLLAVFGAPLHAQAIPDRLLVTGSLAFDGEATLGDFTGTTTTVAGRLLGAESLAAVRGHVTAPARSLVTGNDRRDRDMYRSLEADRYPLLRYDLLGVRPGRVDGDSTAVTLRGRFTIHGVSRDVEIPGWAWLGADATRFRGQTPLNLKAYQIGGLSKLLGTLKMHEEILVRIDLAFRT